jgi:hypothetical protein
MACASCKKIARLISHGDRHFASVDLDNNRTVTQVLTSDLVSSVGVERDGERVLSATVLIEAERRHPVERTDDPAVLTSSVVRPLPSPLP